MGCPSGQGGLEDCQSIAGHPACVGLQGRGCHGKGAAAWHGVRDAKRLTFALHDACSGAPRNALQTSVRHAGILADRLLRKVLFPDVKKAINSEKKIKHSEFSAKVALGGD